MAFDVCISSFLFILSFFKNGIRFFVCLGEHIKNTAVYGFSFSAEPKNSSADFIHMLLLFIAASDTNNTPVGAAACAGIGFCRNKQN